MHDRSRQLPPRYFELPMYQMYPLCRTSTGRLVGSPKQICVRFYKSTMKPITFLLATLLGTASAGTINVSSSAANTLNNSGSSTVNIVPHPAWASAFPGSHWVSNAPTGDPASPGYLIIPNGTVITFSQAFNLNGPVTDASLSVMADDTTSVMLNGMLIYAATNLGVDGYPLCSAQPIGCLMSTRKDFGLADLQAAFQIGVNTISFGVVQRNAVSFGLDYAGSVTDLAGASASMPEPLSFGLIGVGLVSFSLLRRYRRHTTRASSRAITI